MHRFSASFSAPDCAYFGARHDAGLGYGNTFAVLQSPVGYRFTKLFPGDDTSFRHPGIMLKIMEVYMTHSTDTRMRIERDSIGTIEVPADAYYGANRSEEAHV